MAGLRLYATVLVIGISIRYGLFHPPADLANLKVLADPTVLILAGIAFCVEFVADKVPWVDSIWDSFHTIIRPIGAAVLAAAALHNISPGMKIAIVILCGGVALTTHTSKAATRLMANHSPEPFSNIALSLAGDVFTPVGVWLALAHPVVTFVAVAVFIVVFVAISSRIFRFIKRQLSGFRAQRIRVAPTPAPERRSS